MKKLIVLKYFFWCLFTTQSSLLYCQTFSNTTAALPGSWNATLTRTISVVGLPALSASLELIQVNLHIGNPADGGYNLSRYTATLTSPTGTVITIVVGDPITPTTFPGSVNEANIKFRSDDGFLQYPNTFAGTAQPWHIGYYKIATGSSFTLFNGENPNGNWALTITENSVQTGIRFNKVELVFAPALVYNNVTSSNANDSCSATFCIEQETILIGTNNGYTNPGDPATDPTTTSAFWVPSCSWNGAQNNSAWFSFIAGASTSLITISGITGSLQIIGLKVKPSGTACVANDWEILPGGCPDDEIINDTYISPEYFNGSDANMQLNLSGLIIGETYYLVVDGTSGAISPFEIEISNTQPCCSIMATITGSLSYCTGFSTILDAGAGYTTYNWSTTATTQTITATTANNPISVTVTDASGCTGTLSVNVTENPTYNTPATAAICTGDSIFLQGAYQTTAGTYYDTLSTINSCDSVIATTLTVNQTYNISETATICSGDSIFLQGVYQTTAETYYDTLLTINSCDSVIATTLTVNQTYNISETATICSGDSILLGGAYQTTAGTYYDTLLTINSCDSVIATTLTVNTLPTPVISGSLSYCTGFNTILDAGASYITYNWSTTATTQTINATTANNPINVTVTDASGCTGTSSVNVTESTNPIATISPNITIIYGSSTTLQAGGGDIYNWLPDTTTTLSCTNCDSPVASPLSTTTYCMLVTNSNGCTDSACVKVEVNLECGEVFVPSGFSPNGDGKNDILYVRGNCIKTMDFRIFNRWGEKVFESTDHNIGWDGNYKGKPCDTDVFVYYLKAETVTGLKVNTKGNITLMK